MHWQRLRAHAERWILSRNCGLERFQNIENQPWRIRGIWSTHTSTRNDLARRMAQIVKESVERRHRKLERRKVQIARRSPVNKLFEVSPEDTDYLKVISDALVKLKKCVVPSMPCIPKAGCLEKLVAMPILQRSIKLSATIISKSTEHQWQTHQTHMDHMATIKEGMKIPQARTFVHKAWDKIMMRPTWELQESQNQRQKWFDRRHNPKPAVPGETPAVLCQPIRKYFTTSEKSAVVFRWRSSNFQKFTPIETTSLNISPWATATSLRAGGCYSRPHASQGKCFRVQSLRRLLSLLERVSPLVVLMGVPGSGDFSRCPAWCAQGHRSSFSNPSCPDLWKPQMASTHVDSHWPSHHALVDVVANDSLSHESPGGYTAHIVEDSHLQGATAELTVCWHVVVGSKWPVESSSVLSSSSLDASLFTKPSLSKKRWKFHKPKLPYTKPGTRLRSGRRGNFKKVKPKAEVVRQATKDGRSVRLASLWDVFATWSISRSREEVVLRRDNVKDDNGHAVFEEGPSASQMAAATFPDTMSSLPRMEGEANETVSACTQVPKLDSSACLKLDADISCSSLLIRRTAPDKKEKTKLLAPRSFLGHLGLCDELLWIVRVVDERRNLCRQDAVSAEPSLLVGWLWFQNKNPSCTVRAFLWSFLGTFSKFKILWSSVISSPNAVESDIPSCRCVSLPVRVRC